MFQKRRIKRRFFVIIGILCYEGGRKARSARHDGAGSLGVPNEDGAKSVGSLLPSRAVRSAERGF